MIHDENPFSPTEDNPARRFRGRLAAAVTIITAGDEVTRTGLTVSSLMVVEGDPAQVQAVITPNSDLFDIVAVTGRFVVHVCDAGNAGLADVFAGIRPSPGGIFAGSEVEQTRWGPALVDLQNRLYCSTTSVSEAGWSGILIGAIDEAAMADLTQPLIYFRGDYRHLE